MRSQFGNAITLNHCLWKLGHNKLFQFPQVMPSLAALLALAAAHQKACAFVMPKRSPSVKPNAFRRFIVTHHSIPSLKKTKHFQLKGHASQHCHTSLSITHV